MEKIKLAVSNVLNVDVTTTKRKVDEHTADCLCIFSQIAREAGMTTTRVGDYISKDHSTIVYYGKRFKDLIAWDKEFQNKYKLINSELKMIQNCVSL